MERRVVHVAIFVERPLRLLLLRRPESRAAGWQGVTGRVEPEDANGELPPMLRGAPATHEIPTLVRAALREISEETGLPPPPTLWDLALERRFDGYDGVTYLQRSFAAAYADPIPIQRTPEHEEARWVLADEADALFRWESDRAALARIRLGLA